MRARASLYPIVAFLLAACASGGSQAPSAPPPEPARPRPEQPATARPAPSDSATAVAEPDSAMALTAAPDAWQLLDLATDRVPGVSAQRAYRELLADRTPQRTVVVAVIDGGVDTAHVDLREVLWHNPGETAGNGVDDDGNGYVDDVYGWNFIGGADGRNVNHETLEVTRLHARCQAGETITGGSSCEQVDQEFQQGLTETQATLQQIQQIEQALDAIIPMLRQALGGAEPTSENVRGLQPSSLDVQRAQQMFLQLDQAGITRDDIVEAKQAYEGLLQYGYDPTFETRDIVGDDYEDGSESSYGNRDVMGPDASHGTHVSGIIGAVRGNGVGMDGIATNVRIMMVRTVPDGDERDKDVANAIRYAVDNGADIINMSFGKAFSPRKDVVDAAVRYADEHGVLMIHAAGNDGENLEVEASFPTATYADGGRARNWIEVGAANWMVEQLAAPFSNYGRTKVDVFAPGVDILSTMPHDEFAREDGTSMAAPVVTGVAALLMAYFPDLTAPDVKRILLESSVKYDADLVPEPGTGAPVPFGTLSATGGVVNAYQAIRMAIERM